MTEHPWMVAALISVLALPQLIQSMREVSRQMAPRIPDHPDLREVYRDEPC